MVEERDERDRREVCVLGGEKEGLFEGTCSSAATMYIASTGNTAPFIVMETDIFSRGISPNKI